ncbi:MAG: 5-(carboxyamino)imidazole ribonucleotide mutase [Spirochaetaceae bacterium]
MIGIIMGSDSDLPVMREAAETCEELSLEHEVTIVSAHRTPQRLYDYARSARDRNISVIIAGAGGAAHLPGMVAAMTTLPVIGVPVRSSALSGLDSLFSIVQMPRGVPVATVAINNARNAALLAARILSVKEPDLAVRLQKQTAQEEEKVLEKANLIEENGWRSFLEERT